MALGGYLILTAKDAKESQRTLRDFTFKDAEFFAKIAKLV